MAKQSAGILVYRQKNDKVEVLLAHPGGPFWGKKNVWTIPKGETEPNEELLTAAKREFVEETNLKLPADGYETLGEGKQPGKINYIWAVESEPDLSNFACNSMFDMEWPPRSGQRQSFPEIDKIEWHNLIAAKRKLFPAQALFIDRLAEKLKISIGDQEDDQSQQKVSDPQTSLL